MQKMQDEKMKEEIHEDSKKLDTLLEEIRELREIVEKQKSG